MTEYSFVDHVAEWSRVPIDDEGYFLPAELAALHPNQLWERVERMRQTRFNPHGWRNWENKWVWHAHYDDEPRNWVLDFGCGIGIEGLEYRLHGHRVVQADIRQDTLYLARRVFAVYGWQPLESLLVREMALGQKAPFFSSISTTCSIFHASGVLHHFPYAADLLRFVAKNYLDEESEIRLMLYSDRGWAKYAEAPVPPVEDDVRDHPAFSRFVRAFDSVGHYADWYNADKLQHRFGDFLRVRSCDYITYDDRYLFTTLVRR